MVVMAYKNNYTALMTEKLDEDCQGRVLKQLFLVEQPNTGLPAYPIESIQDDLIREFEEQIECCDVCKMHKLTSDSDCTKNVKNHFNTYWSFTDQKFEKNVCKECSEDTLYQYIHYGEVYRSLRWGNLEELQREMNDAYFVNFMKHICDDTD